MTMHLKIALINCAAQINESTKLELSFVYKKKALIFEQ